jgi:hypothetical protein
MAIFTVTSNAVENVDIFISSSFKAGMALMRDDNGRGVAADSQLLISKTIEQKFGKFLGFATSDHTSIANTIIIPDVIGSSYIDSSYNFVRTENNEIAVSKRAVNDYLNEGVNSLFNPSDSSVISKRGMAVYNQPNNIFITDQFKAVLHGDYGLDGLGTVALNPGDLLTFGGGINAGKLVKVNVNSFGPDILVVGIVEKYVASTNLLHFKQVNYSLSFGANPYILAIDAGNPVSYVSGSTNTTNLVNATSGGTLVNGTSYSSANSGAWVFDGVNDYINTSFNTSLFTANATMLLWLQLDSNTPDSGQTGLSGFAASFAGNNHYPWTDGRGYFTIFRSDRIDSIVLSSLDKSTIHLLVITINATDWKLYQNTTLITTSTSLGSVKLSDPVIGTNSTNTFYNYKGKIFQFNLLNQALTATQITNYYNATKSRYGL